MAKIDIDYDHIDEIAMAVKSISDRTGEAGTMEERVAYLNSHINSLNEIWNSKDASETQIKMTNALKNLSALQLVLNNDGAVLAQEINEILDMEGY